MDRVKLPNRRFQVTGTFKYEDPDTYVQSTWHISIGVNDEGQGKEVFARAFKPGSEFEGLLDDACVMVSLLLQSGHSLEDLNKTLTREKGSKLEFVLNCAYDLEKYVEVRCDTE